MESRTGSVQVLPAEVARRIAAGEVIEKPASVVRELLDNSIDAGAAAIDVSWDEGGLREIRVHDDGAGMSRDDLALCWKPHATSKIRSLEDLERTSTLGFRGEALSSIAAVSDLTIESSGWRLHVRDSTLLSLDQAPERPGTTVVVRDLFSNLPARRRFLSRASAEGTAIRTMVLEKALPVPEVRFVLSRGARGDVSREPLPPQDQAHRVAAVFGDRIPGDAFTTLEGSGEGFQCRIVAAHPEVIRRDRRLIQVFVNRRRVRDYSLMQAVEYGYHDVQHGGVFPVAAVLLTVDPSLVDFNIHPAKQEVRLRNRGEIHQRIVQILRGHLRTYAVRAAVWHAAELPDWQPSSSGSAPSGSTPSGSTPSGSTPSRGSEPRKPRPREELSHHHEGLSHHREERPTRHTPPSRGTAGTVPQSFQYHTRATPDLRFLGTIFGTYNLVEHQDRLFIIDQHAAHERLLYNRLREDRTPQALLIPEPFDVTEDQDALLQRYSEEYRKLGIVLEREDPGRWRLVAMPAAYGQQAGALIETVCALEGLEDALDRTFLARMACHKAVKAGDTVDATTGAELARRVFALEEPRCPHGRPLWVELTRTELEKMIGRR